MDACRQAEQAELSRSKHCSPPLLLLPNAWDDERPGVRGGRLRGDATTSGGVAWVLGYHDGEKAPWREVVAATARIVRAAKVPVTADIEAGYGDTPEAVQCPHRPLFGQHR